MSTDREAEFVRQVDYFLQKLIPIMEQGMKDGYDRNAFGAALQTVLNMGLTVSKRAGKEGEFMAALEWANRDTL